MVAEVITLREHSLQDIPAMLRRCADRIEAGEHGTVTAMAAVAQIDGDDIQVWGWGATDCPLHTCGLLTIGAQFMGFNHRILSR